MNSPNNGWTTTTRRLLLIQEILQFHHQSTSIPTTVRARVFEDNQGAFYLATSQRVTNRTRYFLVGWHWFWSHREEFEVHKVKTQYQRGDYLSKGMVRSPFENNRFLVQGW